jgi:hypothetical protein
MIPDQSATSTNCGYFCIQFLKDRLKGDSFKKASGFDQKGEGKIEAFKKTLPKFRILTYDKQTGEGVLRNAWNWAKGKLNDTVESVKNRVKDVLGGYRLKFGPTIKKLLEKHGDEKISSIKVLREPINSMINTILNWVTNGKFDENIKKNGYDSAMHLYMYVQLGNGTTIRMDKDEVIHAKIVNFDNQGKNVESVNVGSSGNTLNEFLKKGIDSVGESDYFIYRSSSTNCQHWIRSNLKANGLWSESVNKFVMQQADAIYKDLGLLEKINQKITDIAHIADVAIEGAGANVIQKRRKVIK